MALILVPEHLSYSRAGSTSPQPDEFNIPEPTTFKTPPLSLEVSASVYYPERNQTDDTPLITADGSHINPNNPKKHRWAALSRNLLKRWGGNLNFGDSVLVKGISRELDGIYVVRDVMNKRLKNRIDILVGRKDQIFGRWDQVQITPIGRAALTVPVNKYPVTAAGW